MTVFAVLDARVEVRAPAGLIEDLARYVGPASPESPTTRLDAENLVSALTGLNALALSTCEDLALHAGVVAHGSSALAFPGVSGLGKTTLTAACLQQGLTYVSDEALVLRRSDGSVRPYPRPLGVSPWTIRALALPVAAAEPEVHVPPALLGAVVDDCALRLRHVVIPRRVPGRSALAPLHRADAVEHLLARGFNHVGDPVGSLALVVATVRGADCWTLDLDDPVEAALLLAQLLRRA